MVCSSAVNHRSNHHLGVVPLSVAESHRKAQVLSVAKMRCKFIKKKVLWGDPRPPLEEPSASRGAGPRRHPLQTPRTTLRTLGRLHQAGHPSGRILRQAKRSTHRPHRARRRGDLRMQGVGHAHQRHHAQGHPLGVGEGSRQPRAHPTEEMRRSRLDQCGSEPR